MPKIGTAGCSFWGSTELSLCKQVELWEFACPPSYIIAPIRNSQPAQPGASGDSIPKRSQISGAVQHEDAGARTPVEINDSGADRESVNVSQRGIYFATNSLLHEGETVEVFFNMPEIVLGEPASEWRRTGHVVRVEAIAAAGGKLGVGVQFDSYEVARSKPTDWATGMAIPPRMIADTGLPKNREDAVAVGNSVGGSVELCVRRNFR